MAKQFSLTGRSVLVTGGGSGIGAAIAERAAHEGARVAIADRDGDAASRVSARLPGQGHLGFELDVTDADAVDAVVDEIQTRFGQIDTVFSNAGINRGRGIGDVADWTASFGVHVLAHIYLAQKLIPGMASHEGGYFVITASAAGLLSNLESAPYTATKHAAVALAEWLAITYGDHGVHVACVCPQGVRTGMTKGRESAPTGSSHAREPEEVVDTIWDSLGRREFLVLPHPEVAAYERRRTEDRERWLAGMRRMRDRMTRNLNEDVVKEAL
ncbi:SDR family oxidoreductase [Rhodococcus sp. WS4]|nr:SDR family oxidoreductase [Rhodococcus sp. WS4]